MSPFHFLKTTRIINNLSIAMLISVKSNSRKHKTEIWAFKSVLFVERRIKD